MQAKILTALLIERLITEARLFPPPGVSSCTDERQWVVFKEVRDTVLHVLQKPLSMCDLLRHGSRIAAGLRENRWSRPRQALKHHRLIVRLN